METTDHMRSSAQGLLFIMTLGIGGFCGSYGGGRVIDYFTTSVDNILVRNWPIIWLVFAGYALLVGILFSINFKYKHK